MTTVTLLQVISTMEPLTLALCVAFAAIVVPPSAFIYWKILQRS